MKRLLIIIALTLIAAMSLVGCSSGYNSDIKLYSDNETDSQYVKEKGTLIVGITYFEPMDYREDGEWVGFDAEMSKEFANNLGVNVSFVEIDWDNKVDALESGEIDCVWNGMTLSDKVKESMKCTKPYLKNSQTIVVQESNADKIKSIEDCTHYLFAIESGSTGEQELNKLKYRYIAADTQNDAIKKVADKTADAAVIDSVMAGAKVGKGSEYPELVSTISISDEEYGVGFRKNSDMAEMLDEFFDKSYEDGEMTFIAEKYGVESSLVKRD